MEISKMKTKNKSETDALRQELINGYFSKPLLKGYDPFTAPDSLNSLILDIINKKAKRVAFPPFHLPISLKGEGTTAISNLCSEINNFYTHLPIKCQTDFDDWFYKTADKFIVECGYKVTFGNAQKIINITLKHLYAYADVTKLGQFKYCHFTLDRYTYGAAYCKANGFYEDITSKKVETCWTKLSQSEYKDCQKDIRTYFSSSSCTYQDVSGGNLTPFEAEFIIWQDYKK